jgi:hypothetical protein
MRRLTILLGAVLLTGCHDASTPAAPSDSIVERFSGTVEPGRVSHNAFTTTVLGEIKVTLVTLTPGNEVVGVLFGQVPQRIGVTNCAGPNNVVTAADIGKPVLLSDHVGETGLFCADVYDVAFWDHTIAPLHNPQMYTIEVTHPR